jgi:Fe2+ or Zn2+ uptake regulation protein
MTPDYLICLECGRVIEFRSPEIQSIEGRVQEEHSFVPVRHRLEIYGHCRECHEAGAALPDQGLTCPIDTA